MRSSPTFTGDQLANDLCALGVNFVLGGKKTDEMLFKQPSRLIGVLAQSGEARLRLSLIPLFLEHPEYAGRVLSVAKNLAPAARLNLQCYYSAAVWLAKKIADGPALPDHFSQALNLAPGDDPEENLRALETRQQELSGTFVNWLATYYHAEQVWRKGQAFKGG